MEIKGKRSAEINLLKLRNSSTSLITTERRVKLKQPFFEMVKGHFLNYNFIVIILCPYIFKVEYHLCGAVLWDVPLRKWERLKGRISKHYYNCLHIQRQDVCLNVCTENEEDYIKFEVISFFSSLAANKLKYKLYIFCSRTNRIAEMGWEVSHAVCHTYL